MLKLIFLFAALFGMACGLRALLFPKKVPRWVEETPIAHRGYFDNEKGIPENSLAAIQRAVDKGYAIEFDVMLTGDGHAIAHHDDSLVRMTGVDKNVDHTSLKEIRSLNLLRTSQKIPTLQEVLQLVDGKVPLLIEMKKDYLAPAGDLEKAILEQLKSYHGQFALISFNPYSLAYIRKHAPAYVRGLDYEPWPEEDSIWPETGKSAFKVFVEIAYASWYARPHILICGYQYLQPWVKAVLRQAQKLVVYTVKSDSDSAEAKKHAHNIIFEKIEP